MFRQRTSRRRSGSGLGTSADRAAYSTLHTASLAAPHLREGLTPAATAKAITHLRDLLEAPALAICNPDEVVAWDADADVNTSHRSQVATISASTLTSGRTSVPDEREVSCTDPQCPARTAVSAPIVVDEHVVATLVAFVSRPTPTFVRAVEEVANYVAGQVELAELSVERTRAMEAELRALRAQISPHFVYNALAAIASFVRTDPDRARELILEFADFTRYALRRGGEFTTLADELRNVERYLALEQARFGDRMTIALRVAPEVLPVAVPFLALQPLVENAVKHGIEGTPGAGRITIIAENVGTEAEISVEDNGAGSDPEVIRAVLAGDTARDSIGLGNVDARLRQVYGDRYGLVVETAPGAGTKVSFRVPKFAAGVHSSA